MSPCGRVRAERQAGGPGVHTDSDTEILCLIPPDTSCQCHGVAADRAGHNKHTNLGTREGGGMQLRIR